MFKNFQVFHSNVILKIIINVLCNNKKNTDIFNIIICAQDGLIIIFKYIPLILTWGKNVFHEQTNICFLSWNNTRNFKYYNLFTMSYPYLSILYSGFSEKSIQVYIS